MRIKICGITRVEDALAAEAAGADAVGLIFVKRSKRHVTLEQAQPVVSALGPFISKVGVFVDAPLGEVIRTVHQLRLDAVQLHGQENEAYASTLRRRVQVIRALSFKPSLTPEALNAFSADALLLDGLEPGSGSAFAWAQASHLAGHPGLILAGGLKAETVAAGIAALKPYAVDVASGVEAAAGVKDHRKIQDFVSAVRAASSTQSYPQPAR